MHDVKSLLSNFLEVWHVDLANTAISTVVTSFSQLPDNRNFYGRGLEDAAKASHTLSRIMQSLVVLKHGYPPAVWNHMLTIPTPVLFDVCFLLSAMSNMITSDNQDTDILRYTWFYNFALQLSILVYPKDELARVGYIEELIDIAEIAPNQNMRPIFMNESANARGLTGPIIH